MPYSQEPGLKPDLLNAHPGLKAKAPAVRRKRRNLDITYAGTHKG